MTQQEATDMATELLGRYPTRGFDISMPDRESYNLMRTTINSLGREAGPDGDFFVVRVSAVTAH
jgi:hypothetical protein